MSATNRGAVRNESDFYPTPLSAFKPLLPFIKEVVATCPFGIDRIVWEPACGDGRLIRCMQADAIAATGNDLNASYDYLQDKTDRFCVVTNPPFTLAQEFVTQATALSTHTFMLLRLNFLGSQKRKQWWQAHEPAALFVLSERPSFTGHGTDATDYAWFYWGDCHHGVFHL